jgi:hypothetical protein
MNDTLAYLLVVTVVVFLVVRWFWLWYWKVNEQVSLLKDIRAELRGLRTTLAERPAVPPTANGASALMGGRGSLTGPPPAPDAPRR